MVVMRARVFVSFALAATIACGSGNEVRPGAARSEVGDAAPAMPDTLVPADNGQPRIVVLGDSLTAGLGIALDQSYPTLLQQRLKAKGRSYQVVNAGVSGDTSAGGLSRLDWALRGDVRILIVALGANDGLRGIPVEELKDNLAEIIERAQARGITVILAGMEAPPNWGRPYATAFHEVYPELAKRYRVQFVPFLLQGVAGEVTLNQGDGMHPTAEGARIIADNVWSVLEPVLDRQPDEPPGS